ncbi:Trimethyllysine dioxygenase, mitochondrial, partial [Orchesella cincta]
IRRGRYQQLRLSSQSQIANVKFDVSKILSFKLPKESNTLHVHSVWLRHHCQCEKCYNYKTHQRVRIPSDLPNTSSVKNFTLKDKEWIIDWNDDHTSTFNIDWLKIHAPKSLAETSLVSLPGVRQEACRQSSNYYYNKCFKKVESILNDPLEVAIHFDEFMKAGNEGVTHLLSKILRHGYGIVNHCPPDFETTKKVILKVSHPQNTIYGDFSEWTSDLAHADTAYTSDVVHMHTDTSYFTEPIGLQVFHCLTHNGTGGLNSLVDGFQIAKQIARDCQESYELLSTLEIPSQYVDEGKHHFHHKDVTFGHDKTTFEIHKIRYNPHDMAVLKDLPFEHVERFYQSLVNLSNIIEGSQQTIKLSPGLVLFLDNWRALHGRTAYTGFRHLCGAYISRSDWLSRARTLGLLKDY